MVKIYWLPLFLLVLCGIKLVPVRFLFLSQCHYHPVKIGLLPHVLGFTIAANIF